MDNGENNFVGELVDEPIETLVRKPSKKELDREEGRRGNERKPSNKVTYHPVSGRSDSAPSVPYRPGVARGSYRPTGVLGYVNPEKEDKSRRRSRSRDEFRPKDEDAVVQETNSVQRMAGNHFVILRIGKKTDGQGEAEISKKETAEDLRNMRKGCPCWKLLFMSCTLLRLSPSRRIRKRILFRQSRNGLMKTSQWRNSRRMVSASSARVNFWPSLLATARRSFQP